MKAVGLITEYNPFHNGHKYHIEKSLEVTNSDIAVVVMNGNFVQRGAPAIIDKYTRTKMALAEGAHMVFELPTIYGLSSARDFAFGAVSILNELPFVKSLCFGSESGELESLTPFAELFANEPEPFRAELQQHLRNGESFPLARENTARKIMNLSASTPLSLPNNLLGIEYIISLIQSRSDIVPFTIPRKHVGYHDHQIVENFASATSIRELSLNEERKNVMPKKASKIYETAMLEMGPIDAADFSDLIYYALRSSEDTLEFIKDITPELANRILNLLPQYKNVIQFINLLSTKQYTNTRIQRILFQVLLSITTDQPKHTLLRLLGLRREATPLLSQISKRDLLVTNTAKAKENLSKNAYQLLKKDFFATDLYHYVVNKKYNVQIPNEYKHSPIILS